MDSQTLHLYAYLTFLVFLFLFHFSLFLARASLERIAYDKHEFLGYIKKP